MNAVARFWNSKSEAAKSAFVFTLAILLSRGISIISTPIFTRIMPTDQIGVVGLFTSYFAVISSITSLALNSGGFMVGLKDFANKRNEYISSLVTLTTLTGLLLFAILCYAPTFWARTLGMTVGLLFLLVFGCVVTPAFEFWLMRQRYEYQYKKAALLTVLTSVLSTLFAVVAVIASKDIPEHLGEIRLYVATGSTLLVYLFVWVLLLVRGKTYYHKVYWSFSLSLSLPLLGHSFASQMLSVSDRFFIGKIVDNSAVGIYSTLYSVGSLALMFWGALNSSFVPYLFQNLETEQQKKEVSKNTALLLGGFSLLTIAVSLLAPDIVAILAPKVYLDSVEIVPPIVAGVYFIAVGNIYSNLLVYYKNTIAIMFSSVAAGVISVVLNILLIPKLGFEVAAYNTLFSYVAFALFQSVGSCIVYRKKSGGNFVYNNKIMLGIVFITVLLTMLCILLYQNNIVRYIVALFTVIIIIYLYKSRLKLINNLN